MKHGANGVTVEQRLLQADKSRAARSRLREVEQERDSIRESLRTLRERRDIDDVRNALLRQKMELVAEQDRLLLAHSSAVVRLN